MHLIISSTENINKLPIIVLTIVNRIGIFGHVMLQSYHNLIQSKQQLMQIVTAIQKFRNNNN